MRVPVAYKVQDKQVQVGCSIMQTNQVLKQELEMAKRKKPKVKIVNSITNDCDETLAALYFTRGI